MVTFGGIAPPRSSLGWLLGLYSMARASDARRAALRRDAGDKHTTPRRNVRRGADRPDAVVRGSAGLRAQRQLDVVALLVLAKGLRVALGRRSVAARRRGGLAVGLGLVLGERRPARE